LKNRALLVLLDAEGVDGLSVLRNDAPVEGADQRVDLHPDLDVEGNAGNGLQAQLALVQAGVRTQRSGLELVLKSIL
jgi:hypothetical protein